MEREGTIVPMNELGDILRKQLTSPAEAKRELLDLLTTYVLEKIPSMSKREAMQTLEHETDEFLMSLLKPESMMTHINVERERMRTLRRPRKLSRGKIWGSGKHQSY
jgi:predicted transposase YdaD